MSKENIVYLSLGSNLGERQENLEKALKSLLQLGNIEKTSSIHETKAWGKTDQPDFLNMAVKIRTSFEPLLFLEKIQAIETGLGRIRTEKWGPRTIDIDIIFWNEETIDHPNLTVPHPHAAERGFVRLPLQEIGKEMPRVM